MKIFDIDTSADLEDNLREVAEESKSTYTPRQSFANKVQRTAKAGLGLFASVLLSGTTDDEEPEDETET
jgi:hypothetical protein